MFLKMRFIILKKEFLAPYKHFPLGETAPLPLRNATDGMDNG